MVKWSTVVALVPCFVGLLWLISFSPWWFSEASIKADHGIGTLDLQFASSIDEARATLDQLGPAGRSAYDTFQIVDIVFPLSYALALSGLIWSLWRGVRHPWAVYLAAFPIVGAGLDYVENILVRVALNSYPETSRGELGISVTVTTIKLVLSYGSQALVVVGLILEAVRYLRGRGQNRPLAVG